MRWILLTTLLFGSLSWGQGTNGKFKRLPPKKKASPSIEVEPDFYDTEVPPPGEEMPPDSPEASEPPDSGIEFANPDDASDIEYADEAERSEAENAKKKQEEEEKKKLLRKQPKPPVNEPMPLIRRQREAVNYSNKTPAKYIQHPNAAKGLTKINRDGSYIYKVKASDQTKSSTVHIGLFEPTKLKNPETGLEFEEFYETSNPALLFDYEWQVFQKFGKLGFKLGSGLAVATGSGQFKTQPPLNGNVEPKEKFTFAVIPNSVGLVYRLQYIEDQIFVPYIEGGGTGFVFGEFRDDGEKPRFGGAFGAYAAGGVAFSLDFLDRISMLELDREYSINSIYILAEYRTYVGFGDFDFTSNLINVGFMVEF